MRMSVLGTGPVGEWVADKLSEMGRGVAGTRGPATTVARTDTDSLGEQIQRRLQHQDRPLRAWRQE